MKYSIGIIKKSGLQISKWSGGTTTELLIYPENANYNERNFKWRLSSAKVQIDESVFTYLPGISRVIMIIDGKLVLEHEGHHKIVLNPFEQDSFMGDWKTKSFGMVTDFNLMMDKGCTGKLEALSISTGNSITISLNENNTKIDQITDVFYCVGGIIELSFHDKLYNIGDEDLLWITRLSNKECSDVIISNKGNCEAKVIRATILY